MLNIDNILMVIKLENIFEIKNDFWKIERSENCFYSNFAYPIIHPNKNLIVKD